MQIVQPPMSRSRSCEASDDESDAIIAEPEIDRAVMECEIISQMDHPNVVATYKYSQIPLQYKVASAANSKKLVLTSDLPP